MVVRLIPDQQTADEVDDPAIALDDRLLTSPGLAIQHCRDAVLQMGKLARKNFSASVRQLNSTITRKQKRSGNGKIPSTVWRTVWATICSRSPRTT